MKITEIKTYLMHAGTAGGGWVSRNWLFIKIFTDEGIYGVGEASGWPRVVETVDDPRVQQRVAEVRHRRRGMQRERPRQRNRQQGEQQKDGQLADYEFVAQVA